MTTENPNPSFSERIDVAGDQVVAAVKQLLKDGSVRRIILRDDNGRELFSVPMNVGAAVGGLAVLAAPTLAAVGAITALVTKVTIDIERTDITPEAPDVVDIEPDSPAE